MASKWGFVSQGPLYGFPPVGPPQNSARLIHAQPVFIKVVDRHSESIGAIRSIAPKGTTFVIFRRVRDQQHLDNPITRAEEHYRMIKEKWDDRFDATTGFNEVGTFNPEQNEAYCQFQEHLGKLLWEQDGIFLVHDCDSTWYPGWPPGTGLDPEWPWFWERRLEMYRRYSELTGKAVLRCRHEYYAPPFPARDVERHVEELRWLREQAQDIDMVVGEWGWDQPTPDRGHLSWWEQGVTNAQYLAMARRSDSLPAAGRCAYIVNGFGEWADFNVEGGHAAADQLWQGPWGEEPLIAMLWEGQPPGGVPVREWYRIREAKVPEAPIPDPEYPGAVEFIPVHPNGRFLNPDGSPETHAKTRLLIHYTGGGSAAFSASISWWKSPVSKVQAQYIVRRDGRAYQTALEEWACKHAGDLDWNRTSVGIEICNNNLGELIAEPAYAALIPLCKYLVAKWNIPITRDDIKGHFEIVSDRKDPVGFPWDRFMADLANGQPPPGPPFGDWAERLRSGAAENLQVADEMEIFDPGP